MTVPSFSVIGVPLRPKNGWSRLKLASVNEYSPVSRWCARSKVYATRNVFDGFILHTSELITVQRLVLVIEGRPTKITSLRSTPDCTPWRKLPSVSPTRAPWLPPLASTYWYVGSIVRTRPSVIEKRDWPRMLPVFDGLICTPRRLAMAWLWRPDVAEPPTPPGSSGVMQVAGSDPVRERVRTFPAASRQTLGKTMLWIACHWPLS